MRSDWVGRRASLGEGRPRPGRAAYSRALQGRGSNGYLDLPVIPAVFPAQIQHHEVVLDLDGRVHGIAGLVDVAAARFGVFEAVERAPPLDSWRTSASRLGRRRCACRSASFVTLPTGGIPDRGSLTPEPCAAVRVDWRIFLCWHVGFLTISANSAKPVSANSAKPARPVAGLC